MANSSIELRDRFLGCLLGCAVGDALGAPYEGLWSHSIPDIETLLSGFAEFEGFPPGQYTDDTQLSLATVEAILDAEDVIPAVVARHIARLWKTQSVVGPGGACTQAAHRFLKTGDWTSCGAPAGQAGNGTAMRTAVLGLFFLRETDRLPDVVADISRITHQDPRSVAGGVAIAKAAQLLTNDVRSPEAFCQEIAEATEVYEPQFAGMVRELPLLMMKSPESTLQHIAWSGMARPEFDKPIITPFVIPTVLASLWCLLENLASWSKAVAKAIGLGGDVDTLGAVVGALMGTRLGVAGIPHTLRGGAAFMPEPYLELEEKLRHLADPLSPPRPGDWLAEHDEPGQTFAEYLDARPVRKSDKLHTIYLCLVGDFSEAQRRILALTQDYLAVFFDCPVKVQRQIALASIPTRARRIHPSWGDPQVLTGYILHEILDPERPAEALAYLALTASDLWPGKGWNFVFGEANLRQRTGVWSIYRNGDPGEDFTLYLRRTLSTASHETGHILGLAHCTAYSCLMNGSNHQEEKDRRPMHLCPVCLRKLCWNLRVEPVPYMTRLKAFCQQNGLDPESGWYERAIEALAT